IRHGPDAVLAAAGGQASGLHGAQQPQAGLGPPPAANPGTPGAPPGGAPGGGGSSRVVPAPGPPPLARDPTAGPAPPVAVAAARPSRATTRYTPGAVSGRPSASVVAARLIWRRGTPPMPRYQTSGHTLMVAMPRARSAISTRRRRSLARCRART